MAWQKESLLYNIEAARPPDGLTGSVDTFPLFGTLIHERRLHPKLVRRADEDIEWT